MHQRRLFFPWIPPVSWGSPHLVHQLNEFKAAQKNVDKNQKKKLPPQTKKLLDQLVVEAVVRDARCFTDFDKPGLKKFLQLALPGN